MSQIMKENGLGHSKGSVSLGLFPAHPHNVKESLKSKETQKASG